MRVEGRDGLRIVLSHHCRVLKNTELFADGVPTRNLGQGEGRGEGRG